MPSFVTRSSTLMFAERTRNGFRDFFLGNSVNSLLRTDIISLAKTSRFATLFTTKIVNFESSSKNKLLY